MLCPIGDISLSESGSFKMTISPCKNGSNCETDTVKINEFFESFIVEVSLMQPQIGEEMFRPQEQVLGMVQLRKNVKENFYYGLRLNEVVSNRGLF